MQFWSRNHTGIKNVWEGIGLEDLQKRNKETNNLETGKDAALHAFPEHSVWLVQAAVLGFL